ncbi:MAG: PIN domain-containing protein [Caldilineales bacterium]|nr:PIN domain-containing protein [Caldilineales bacterium]MCW5856999.1 PIN domain-containing protein [Caldilineales bacterium]
MPRFNLFLDSSALIAGVISSSGAARALLQFAEAGIIVITISEQVVVESERAIARKAPVALVFLRQTLRQTGLRIVPSPSAAEVASHADIIRDPTDVPIVVAAMSAAVDFLVTLNRHDFIDDPEVSVRSGLRIGAPADALRWLRAQVGVN